MYPPSLSWVQSVLKPSLAQTSPHVAQDVEPAKAGLWQRRLRARLFLAAGRHPSWSWIECFYCRLPGGECDDGRNEAWWETPLLLYLLCSIYLHVLISPGWFWCFLTCWCSSQHVAALYFNKYSVFCPLTSNTSWNLRNLTVFLVRAPQRGWKVTEGVLEKL